jgi:hypothetical protein
MEPLLTRASTPARATALVHASARFSTKNVVSNVSSPIAEAFRLRAGNPHDAPGSTHHAGDSIICREDARSRRRSLSDPPRRGNTRCSTSRLGLRGNCSSDAHIYSCFCPPCHLPPYCSSFKRWGPMLQGDAAMLECNCHEIKIDE